MVLENFYKRTKGISPSLLKMARETPRPPME